MSTMFASRDILIEDKYKIHIMVATRLGLVVVNDLQDFGENWASIVSRFKIFL